MSNDSVKNRKVEDVKVAIVGVGALGQMVAHQLVRYGYRHLVLIDGDTFTRDNFNRQLYATEDTLGRKKVQVTAEELLKINPGLSIQAAVQFLNPDNGADLMGDAHMAADCVDNGETRLLLEALAEEKGIPLIHGAVEGWFGQVATVYPGDKTITTLYRDKEIRVTSAMVMTVTMAAALQVGEIVKLTTGEGELLRHKVLFIDGRNSEFTVVPVKGCETAGIRKG